MNASAASLERARRAVILRGQHYPIAVIADRLGTTRRTVERYLSAAKEGTGVSTEAHRKSTGIMPTVDHLFTSPEREVSPSLPEVTEVNWRPATAHEASVIAGAHLAARRAEASVLGGLIQ